jgi:hypothetical protein
VVVSARLAIALHHGVRLGPVGALKIQAGEQEVILIKMPVEKSRVELTQGGVAAECPLFDPDHARPQEFLVSMQAGRG